MNGYIKILAAVLLFCTCYVTFQTLDRSDPVSSSNDLYKLIKSKQEDYYVKPENAQIDPVWKKTPGMNGRKVNVDESYKKMKKDGKFDEDKLVFDQIPPKVSLDDLEASPIYRGHPDKEMVSLLINVSWGLNISLI
ncbi:hypothetical protein [Halobacillus amylolyticus]|uniref:Uncharacterized protein n=1 Tax=Halobacillus amylolyticus TaxID=2932259 RepID=A0ABY4HCR2_9BACI|nr:hypothetical protein [Halobacillus amylolyticus]UOR12684.1 hypothetical protein MUO15_03955 [Halobacillus amylolyticus]